MRDGTRIKEKTADDKVLSMLIEAEVDMGFYDDLYEHTEDGSWQLSCVRISNCSCDCNRCGCGFDFH